VTERGIQLDEGSPFLELLEGQWDLLRLLAYSKNWRQELGPDIFERICIQGQRLSEEDMRKLRSMLRKKATGKRVNRRNGETEKQTDRED